MIDLLQGQEAIPAAPAYVMIRVTNRNSFPIRDRYDGIPVEFKPNETITITENQARHFFGFPGTPDEMAVHMAKRFGWNTIEFVQRAAGDLHPDSPMLFQKYAWNIIIAPVEMELVPKERVKADDGLDVETLPRMDMAPPSRAHPSDPPPDVGAKVGIRKGSKVQHRKNRGGRPRKHPQPAVDPNFTPLG